jgi:hypothetical protein
LILTWCQVQHKRIQGNEYVKQNYEGLLARGERCDDIMINLFKEYMAASDSEFIQYIKTGQLFFIIASTSWAEPMQLIPQVFNVFAIDTLVAFLFTAVTSSIITSMLLCFNDKYQVSQQVQQAVMTFCMWIKFHIITDNASCKQ